MKDMCAKFQKWIYQLSRYNTSVKESKNQLYSGNRRKVRALLITRHSHYSTISGNHECLNCFYQILYQQNLSWVLGPWINVAYFITIHSIVSEIPQPNPQMCSCLLLLKDQYDRYCSMDQNGGQTVQPTLSSLKLCC